MKTLLPEHLKAYLDAANARDVLPMFYLELVSGLRKGELVALLWSDLDAEHKTISVSKQYVRNPSGEVMLSRPKTETSVRQVSIPQDVVDFADPGTQQAPRQPVYVPLASDRRDVPPGFGGKTPRKDTEGHWLGTHPLPRPQTHICDSGSPERRGRENSLQYAGSLRCGLHPPPLHPRHQTAAESGDRDDGEFHGAGHVKQEPQQKSQAGRQNFLSGTRCPFLGISACGSRCGSNSGRGDYRSKIDAQ